MDMTIPEENIIDVSKVADGLLYLAPVTKALASLKCLTEVLKNIVEREKTMELTSNETIAIDIIAETANTPSTSFTRLMYAVALVEKDIELKSYTADSIESKLYALSEDEILKLVEESTEKLDVAYNLSIIDSYITYIRTDINDGLCELLDNDFETIVKSKIALRIGFGKVFNCEKQPHKFEKCIKEKLRGLSRAQLEDELLIAYRELTTTNNKSK